MLEAKAEMRRRGINSPNLADALATTFAFPALGIDMEENYSSYMPGYVPDYNPYSRERMMEDA